MLDLNVINNSIYGSVILKIYIFRYMATSGIDRKLKIWDLRTFKQLQSYKTAVGPSSLCFSQKGLLAAGLGNVVEVRKT